MQKREKNDDVEMGDAVKEEGEEDASMKVRSFVLSALCDFLPSGCPY
jgi:hypothetical protein